MDKIPNIVPITDLRQDATAIVRRVTKLREPFIITQRGRAAAVMVSIEELNIPDMNLSFCGFLLKEKKKLRQAKATILTLFCRKPITC